MLTLSRSQKVVVTVFVFSLMIASFALSSPPVADNNITLKPIQTIMKNDWVTSTDGALSFRILAEFSEIDKSDQLVIIAELRNNTPFEMYVFRPFGDPYASSAVNIRIEGSSGRIEYDGNTWTYSLGSSSYGYIKSNEVMFDRLVLIPYNFKDIKQSGEYKIIYKYKPTGSLYSKDKDGKECWAGEIESNPIVITRK
jgi:hypothetical protein